MNTGKFTGIFLATAMLASPAFAQTAAHPGTTSTTPDTTPSTNGTIGSTTTGTTSHATTGLGSSGPATIGGSAASNNNSPSNTNPVLTDNGNVRASKVIGSSVYNDKDQKIGTIDDILLSTNDKPAQAVLSVGGFLGLDSKLVEVPYSKLQFGDTNKNSDNRVLMQGATKDSLNGMQTYSYASK